MNNNQNMLDAKTKLLIKEKTNFFSKVCLPLVLFLSFIWLNLYASLTELNDVFFNNEVYSSVTAYLIATTIFISLVEYLAFELYFFVYRLFIGFSIYSFMIPKNVLIDKFRIWYVVRNLILGVVFNLRFFFPYISTYLCVAELIMNFMFVFVLYADLKKDFIEPLVGQYVFKTLIMPVLLYEVYIVITQVVSVL